MGKHKNSAQDVILLKFMEEHHDIAKGFVKTDKVKVEALWKELTVDLNSNGPPQKDASGWKKVWVDWKAAIRKKIAHNNSESRATGGGPFNKHVLTSTEESIAQICGIYTVIEGIPGTLEFGATSARDATEDPTQDQPSTSRDAAAASSAACVSPNCASAAEASAATSSASSSCIGGSRKRRRESRAADPITSYIKEQTSSMATIAMQIKKMTQNGKENLNNTKQMRREFKEVNHAIKKLTTALTDSNSENKRHHIQMERLRHDELMLKKQELELEERRLNFEQSSIEKKT